MTALRSVDAWTSTPDVLTARGIWYFAYYVVRRRWGVADPSWGDQASAVLGLALPTMFVFALAAMLSFRMLGLEAPRLPPDGSTVLYAWLCLLGLSVLPHALMAMRKREYQEYRRQFDMWSPGKMRKAKFLFWVALLAVMAGGPYLVATIARGWPKS